MNKQFTEEIQMSNKILLFVFISVSSILFFFSFLSAFFWIIGYFAWFYFISIVGGLADSSFLYFSGCFRVYSIHLAYSTLPSSDTLLHISFKSLTLYTSLLTFILFFSYNFLLHILKVLHMLICFFFIFPLLCIHWAS